MDWEPDCSSEGGVEGEGVRPGAEQGTAFREGSAGPRPQGCGKDSHGEGLLGKEVWMQRPAEVLLGWGSARAQVERPWACRAQAGMGLRKWEEENTNAGYWKCI